MRELRPGRALRAELVQSNSADSFSSYSRWQQIRVTGTLSLLLTPSVPCIIGRTLSPSPPVPVTAKLSKLFYDRLGEPVANELVNWFNDVDLTYRNDLRDLNDRNFALFDAKLEQRFAEADAKVEKRFAESEVKFERRFTDFEVSIERRFSQTDAKIDQLETKLERRLGEQTRWMFAAWATMLITIIGLWARR